MSDLIITERSDIVAIADAVRNKTGTTNEMTLSGIVSGISGISTGADPVLQDKTVTPTTSKQTITADDGYDGLDTVTVNAMPTVTQATPSISISSSGLITAAATQTAGYVSAGTKSGTHQLTTQAAKTVTPTTSSQTAVASGVYTTGTVTVGAIPSTYVKPTYTRGAVTITPSTTTQIISAGTYCTGTQTITGDSNLKAENIAEGVSIFGVTGTLSGSGTDPFEPDGDYTYAIHNISSAAYGFALNSNGYYESQNKGIDGSYAICYVSLNVTTAGNITFDVINYAESNYDYALFSNLNHSLTLSATADTTNVYKSFKGLQSASVVQVTYNNVSAGTHTIYIKFIKDSSQSKNNDSVQFKLVGAGGFPQTTIDKILAADEDLVASNIKSGVDIFGVVGTYEGSSESTSAILETKYVTPTTSTQVITPSGGYTGLRQVTVYGDSDLVASNIKSGVNIFGVTGTYTGSSGSYEACTVQCTIVNGYTYQPFTFYYTDGLGNLCTVTTDSHIYEGTLTCLKGTIICCQTAIIAAGDISSMETTGGVSILSTTMCPAFAVNGDGTIYA